MLTQEDAIKKANAFVAEIIGAGVPIEQAFLFGSYSNGNFTEHSDIDLALVSKVFNGFGFEDRKLFSKINIKDEFMLIETKTYPTDYFISGDPFIEDVIKKGIEI